MFAVIMSSLLNPLTLVPLLPQCLGLIYSLAMVRANPTLGAAPLLTQPLTARRIHAFHAAMQLLGTALPGKPHLLPSTCEALPTSPCIVML